MSNYKLRVIREKAETEFEGSAAPTSADAILCRNLTIRNLDGDWQEQDFVTGNDGAQQEDIYNAHCAADYEVEAAGSGTPGTPPVYAAILTSSGLSEVVAADRVAYSPTPDNGEFGSTTMQMLNGRVTQTVVGVRGSMGFAAEVNRRALFNFRRRGRYGAPEAFSREVHEFPDWGRSPICSPENMAAFTFGGVKLCVRSFSFNDGRNPVVDKYMNCGGTDITGRRYTGRMQIKWPDLAIKDILTTSKDGLMDSLIFELGKEAGQIVRITAPRVQLKFAGEEDIEGDLGASVDLVFLPEQGDDEILIEFL